MKQRQTVTKKKALDYKPADRAGKTRISGELVDLTRFHHAYARTALRNALLPRVVELGPGRRPVYTSDLLPALIRCWTILRAPASRLLAVMLSTLVPMLRRDEEPAITDVQVDLLMLMSPAMINRKLAGERAKMRPRNAPKRNLSRY